MQFSEIKIQEFKFPYKDNYKHEKIIQVARSEITFQGLINDVNSDNILKYILNLFIGNGLIDDNFVYRIGLKYINYKKDYYQNLFLKYFEQVYLLLNENNVLGFELQKLSIHARALLKDKMIQKMILEENIFKYDEQFSNVSRYNSIYKVSNSKNYDSGTTLEYWISIIQENVKVFGADRIPIVGFNKENANDSIILNLLLSKFKNIYLVTTKEDNWKTESVIVF